jgi:DNA polymerase III delta subunit
LNSGSKMVYLFIGQDSPSKDLQLKALRKECLAKSTEQFNLDILHAREVTLKDLQEKLIYLPLKSSKRLLVIKNAQDLKQDAREFILEFVKVAHKQTILILDIDKQDRKDAFISSIFRYAKTLRFKEAQSIDTFTLSRQITLRQPDYALRVLNQLLKNGERPERILGGLRYVWERESASPLETKRRLKFLLNCDIDIKTGRLKPVFALERLVLNLCGLGKPFRQP